MSEISGNDAADALVAKYLNKAGQISNQFVIKLKQASPEVQELVNQKLVAKGLPAYDLNKQGRQRNRSKPAEQRVFGDATNFPTEEPTYGDEYAHTPTPVARVLSDEEEKAKQDIMNLLNGVAADRASAKQFLLDLDGLETGYRKQLGELGITVGQISDPFAAIYYPAHKHARNNREEIQGSTRCGCFFCRASFAPPTVYEFADNGQTALCPYCGIDSVIGDKSGYLLSDDFLMAMFKRWFGIPITLHKPPEQSAIAKDVFKVNEALDQAKAAGVAVPEISEVETPYTPPAHLEEDTSVLTGVGSNLLSTLPDDDDDPPMIDAVDYQ